MKKTPDVNRGFITIDKLGGEVGLQQVEHDPSDTPLEGADDPRSHNAFTSPDGKYTANVWACNAGTLKIDNLAISEACFLLEGNVELTDLEGNKAVYGPGDAFLLPKGFCGYWHMPEPILKYNTMYEGQLDETQEGRLIQG